jgi:hypothetical protein
MKTWRWRLGNMEMEAWRYGDIKRKPENVSPGVLYTTKTSSFYESRK